jgi:hypothetical protein
VDEIAQNVLEQLQSRDETATSIEADGGTYREVLEGSPRSCVRKSEFVEGAYSAFLFPLESPFTSSYVKVSKDRFTTEYKKALRAKKDNPLDFQLEITLKNISSGIIYL